MNGAIGRVMRRFCVFLLSVLLTLSMVPASPFDAATALAATSGDVAGLADQNIGLSFSGEGDNPGDDAWSASGSSVTGQVVAVKGSCSTTDYNSTLTITNKKSATATLSFAYTVSLGGGTVTVDGTSVSTNGTFSKEIGPNETVTVKIKSKGGTTSVTLSNMTLLVNASPQVTFQKAENGTYTVDGATVGDGLTKSKNSSEAYQLVAMPNDGYKFIGWYDSANKVYLSSNASESLNIDTVRTITAVFVKADAAVFEVNGAKYTDLDEAINYAVANEANKITLVDSGTITGQYTIPSGITLLIPMDAAASVYGETPKVVHSGGASTAKNCYKKLTLASGSSLTINGSLNVEGTYYSAAGSDPGKMAGNYGQVQLENGSSVSVANGGSLYAWGFVTGSGSVAVNNGGKAYEWFQITDFRGGSATLGMLGNSDKVFFFNQYFIQNIEAPMTIYQGGSDTTYSALYASGSSTGASVDFIGDNGMFKVVNGSMTRQYDGATDRMTYTVDGEAQLNNLKISALGQSLDSKDYVLPVTNNMTVDIDANSKLTVNQSAALLPGTKVNIAKTGEMNVASGVDLYVYDGDGWDSFWNIGKGQVQYSPSKAYTRSINDMVDATIDVNGTLTANGCIYTTKDGAAITSSEGTGVYAQAGTVGTQTNTYQYTNPGAGGTKTAIAITPAKLKNADASYTETSSAQAGSQFNYSNGTWQIGKESYKVTWVNDDGTVLATDTVKAGETPKYAGATPTKEGNAQYSYTFSGWTPEVSAANADVTYKATYTQTTNKYTVTWKNSDGTVIKTNQVEYGIVPTYEGDTPTKAGDAQYSYAFAGWKAIAEDGSQSDVVAVTGDATYTATYTLSVNTYSVKWVNEDGTLLQSDTDVAYGTTPSYNGVTPTKAADAQYTYTFAGWSPAVDKVTGDITYTATFDKTVNTYTVTWKNGDETLKTEQVEYGTVPVYSGDTPTKDGDAQYSYEFKGWTPEITSVTGDVTYTAEFTQKVNTYKVTWKSFEGTVYETDEVEYGGTPVYTGQTPTKANDEYFSYTFAGWKPSVDESTTVTSDMTFVAQFDKASLYTYTVAFDANGGTGTMDAQSFSSGVPAELAESTFSREGYKFAGWNTKADGTGTSYTDQASVMPTSDMTLYAQWTFTDGWLTDANGKTYYKDGAIAFHGSWQTIDGADYYFKDNGYVATGIYSVAPKGADTAARCVFDADGVFQSSVSGVYAVGSDTYWLNNGVIEEYPGLKQVVSDGQTLYYYFGEDGKAVKDGDYKVDKNNGLKLPALKYHFLESGVIEHDSDTTKNGICEGNDSLFYYIDGVKVGLGLIQIDGSYFYARTSTGEIVHGRSYWITQTNGLGISEGEYRFANDGKMMLDGWMTIDSRTCYYVNGVPAKGLTKVGDDWYLFNRSSGVMYTDGSYWVNEDENGSGLAGGLYKFGADGKMQQTKDGFVEEDGKTYYYVDGAMAKGLTKVGDDWYLFNRSSGAMYSDGTYWVKDGEGGSGLPGGLYKFDASGKLQVRNGFVEEDGKTYYYVDGAMAKGLTKVGDDWYLFNRSSGVMYTDGSYWVKDGEGGSGLAGGLYKFGSDGKMVMAE
jgi:uncharacterized repeat protein (TIGR02543 family)